MYALTDVAGEHFWTGADFVPLDAEPEDLEYVLRFPKRKEAVAEAKRLRKGEDIYLRVILFPMRLLRQFGGSHTN